MNKYECNRCNKAVTVNPQDNSVLLLGGTNIPNCGLRFLWEEKNGVHFCERCKKALKTYIEYWWKKSEN